MRRLLIFLMLTLGGLRSQQPTPQAAATVDLTGYWVSVVTEDWLYRMVTPARGDYTSVPLNPAGRKLAYAWDPAQDEGSGNTCKAYRAAALMQIPGRLHITWQNETTSRSRLMPAPRSVCFTSTQLL
jgi:hypothetical protein